MQFSDSAQAIRFVPRNRINMIADSMRRNAVFWCITCSFIIVRECLSLLHFIIWGHQYDSSTCKWILWITVDSGPNPIVIIRHFGICVRHTASTGKTPINDANQFTIKRQRTTRVSLKSQSVLVYCDHLMSSIDVTYVACSFASFVQCANVANVNVRLTTDTMIRFAFIVAYRSQFDDLQ